jgi:hypothetical protein
MTSFNNSISILVIIVTNIPNQQGTVCVCVCWEGNLKALDFLLNYYYYYYYYYYYGSNGV